MTNEIVLDIETQNLFSDVHNDLRGLRVSVVCVFDYASEKFFSFREDELKNLWPLLEHADRIIGFNSSYFDLPVLNNYYSGDLTALAQLDLLVEVKKNLGTRLKLNDIAKATLKTEKSGDGLQAVELFRAGNWDDLIRYCMDDVRITRDVYEFGRKNKQLFFYDIVSGQMRPFPVNFEMQIPAAEAPHHVNLSLPF